MGDPISKLDETLASVLTHDPIFTIGGDCSQANFDRLRNKGTDAVIIISRQEQKVELKVHSLIMGLTSSVLEQTVLVEENVETFTLFIDCIYGMRADLNLDNLVALIQLSNRYDVPNMYRPLKTLLINALKTLTHEDIYWVYRIINVAEIKNAFREFIFTKINEFNKKLSRPIAPNDMFEIMGSCGMNVNWHTYNTAIVDWAQAAFESRGDTEGYIKTIKLINSDQATVRQLILLRGRGYRKDTEILDLLQDRMEDLPFLGQKIIKKDVEREVVRIKVDKTGYTTYCRKVTDKKEKEEEEEDEEDKPGERHYLIEKATFNNIFS